MKLRNWSHSSLNDVLDGCSWQLYLERFVGIRPDYPDHPRAAGGTAYHAALELHEERRRLWYYSGGRAGSRDGATYEQMRSTALMELEACRVDWHRHDRTETQTEVVQALDHWWQATIPKGQPGEGGTIRDRIMGWRPAAVERRFKLWHPTVTARPIHGSPDTLYVDERGMFTVVDQKSARKFDRYPHDGSKCRPQGAMYARAAREARNMPVRARDGWPRVEFHIARTQAGSNSRFEPVRIVQLQPDDADMRFLDDRARRGDKAIADGPAKNPDWFLCSPEWCQHHVDAGGCCNPVGPLEYVVDVSSEPLPVRVDR